MADGRVSGADDIIATLSSRVSELSKRVAVLQSELESAQRRLAVYEEHDATIQEALSGALRAAYDIRERAETTAEQILEQAREERRLLLKEIERLRDERDQLQNEIAERRRSAMGPLPARPLTSDAAASEIRQLASEALRGLFQEIVDDIRTAPRAAAPEPVAPQRPPEPAAAFAAAEAAPPPAAADARPVGPEPAAQPAPLPHVAETQDLVPEPAAPVVGETVPQAAHVQEELSAEMEEIAPQTPAAAATDEDVEPAVAPAPRLEVVPAPPRFSSEIEEMAPPRMASGAPTADLQLVISPVASFPRLVEIERHIQSLPAVRTLYVRDFRAGTATLAVALRSPLVPEEFGTMLASLEQLRLRVMASARNVIELRVDGEASIA